MKNSSLGLALAMAFALAATAALASSQDAAPLQESSPIVQPSVGRTVIICDQWQWIGNGAITWGCLSTPRRATVASGQVTDEVVASLQKQIDELKAQVQALKPAQH